MGTTSIITSAIKDKNKNTIQATFPLVTPTYLASVGRSLRDLVTPDAGVHGVVGALQREAAFETRHVHRQHDAAADVAGGQRSGLESVLSGTRPQRAEDEPSSDVILILKA